MCSYVCVCVSVTLVGRETDLFSFMEGRPYCRSKIIATLSSHYFVQSRPYRLYVTKILSIKFLLRYPRFYVSSRIIYDRFYLTSHQWSRHGKFEISFVVVMVKREEWDSNVVCEPKQMSVMK